MSFRAGLAADWFWLTIGRRAVVVFTVSDTKQLQRMDVATGPCVPRAGQKKPLQGPMSQDFGESPEQSAALYTALTGLPSVGALELVERARRGQLSVCSSAFLTAMADAGDRHLELADEDEANGNRKELPLFSAAQDDLTSAWRQAVRWPQHDHDSVRNRLGRLGLARQAHHRGQDMFFWHGPAVATHRVVSGTSPYRA